MPAFFQLEKDWTAKARRARSVFIRIGYTSQKSVGWCYDSNKRLMPCRQRYQYS